MGGWRGRGYGHQRYDMFLSCRNYCNQTEKQHEIVVYEAMIRESADTTARKDLIELSQLETNKPAVYSKLIRADYAGVLRDLEIKKQQFTDDEFPPSARSLGQYSDPRKNKIVWRRLHDIVRSPILFSSIDAVDMMQGNLDDCYFVSSLAALAEQPQRIEAIFDECEVIVHGIFKARVSVDGVAKEILVDDWFPVFEQNNQPVFAKPRDNEVWLMVIEKVWAKLSGSYQRITSGYPHEVMSTFARAPCFYSQLSPDLDMTAVWRYLLEATRQRYVVCCGSRPKDKNSLIPEKDDGIVASHTYTLLGAYEVNLESGVHRLVKLRNPWDFKDYYGRYSKHDEEFWRKVDPKVAGNLGLSKNNPVVFMAFADFLQRFESCDMSHVRPSFSYNFETCESQRKHGIYFEVDIKAEQPTECYFTLHQNSLRRAVNRQHLRYSRATMVVATRLSDGTYHYIASKMESEFPSLSVKCRNIRPGKYIVYCKVEWALEKVSSLTLSTYCPAVVEIGVTQKKLHPNFMRNVMLSHAITCPNKQRLDASLWICVQLLYNEGGYAYIVAFVENGPKKILVEFNPEDFLKGGFKVKGVKDPTTRVKLVARAGQPQIVLCRILETNASQQLAFPPQVKISQSI